MFTKTTPSKSLLHINKSYQGETLEQKVRRIMNNKEPISDTAPLTYTERKDGVLPAYNIRTDRFEIAIDAMDYVTKTHTAKREERQKLKDLGKDAKEGMKKEEGPNDKS